jgi:hypothetical protein
MNDDLTVYDLLDALVRRVHWSNEAEQRQYQGVVMDARRRELFGRKGTQVKSRRLLEPAKLNPAYRDKELVPGLMPSHHNVTRALPTPVAPPPPQELTDGP